MVALIGAMTQLPSVVVAPREELGVAAVDLLKVCTGSTLLSDSRSVFLYVVAPGLIPPCMLMAIGLVFIGILLLLA